MTFRDCQILKRVDTEEYDVISFDVFDTLLFRTVAAPKDIFTNVGERLVKETSFGYVPKMYVSIRQRAQERARVINKYYKFDDIFNQYHFDKDFTEKTKAIELEEEQKAVYLNPVVYSLLEHCSSLGKKIILVSDMYLSSEFILSLISSAGGNVSLIDKVFVSCEYGCSKTSGLFEIVKSIFPDIPESRFLHIGDNINADAYNACECGFNAIYYSVTNRCIADIYELEDALYGGTSGELLSLRELAASTAPDDTRLAPFYRIGARVIGPLYALFAEWVVNQAVMKGVSAILCCVREGELFSIVINNVLAERGLDTITCVPFYASRVPLFIASITEENFEEKMDHYFERYKCSYVGVLLGDLGIDISVTPFGKYENTPFDAINEISKREDIIKHIKLGDVKNRILDYSRNQRDCFIKHYNTLSNGGSGYIVDLWNGLRGPRLTNEIFSVMGMERPSFCLLYGKDSVNSENILDGINITSWLGIYKEGNESLKRFLGSCQSVIEVLVSSTHGTLIRYEYVDDKVLPVLYSKESKILAKNEVEIKTIWEGILSFQKLWTKLLRRKPHLMAVLDKTSHMSTIISRFIDSPSNEEANSAGSLPFIDRSIIGYVAKLSGEIDVLSKKDLSFETVCEVYEKYLPSKNHLLSEVRKQSFWSQAAISAAYPSFGLNRYLRGNKTKKYNGILTDIIREGYSKIVIWGAGVRGRKFFFLARENNIHICKFVDQDKTLHGKKVFDTDIVPLERLDDEVDAFVISPKRYVDEIQKNIEDYYRVKKNKPTLLVF